MGRTFYLLEQLSDPRHGSEAPMTFTGYSYDLQNASVRPHVRCLPRPVPPALQPCSTRFGRILGYYCVDQRSRVRICVVPQAREVKRTSPSPHTRNPAPHLPAPPTP